MSDDGVECDVSDNESAAGAEDDDDDLALEQEWAAMAIQRSWRTGRNRQQTHTTVDIAAASRATGGVCCSCFGPLDAPGVSHRPSSSDPGSDDQVFCAACLYALTSAKTPSHGHSAVASPLPKLSKLVQAEARYQDQLELLRAQQALLAQQQQEMENRKAVHVEQLAAERARARARRRLFQLSLARKQHDEALKYGQQAGADARPEHDDSCVCDKPKRPKRMKEMLPVPFARSSAHAAVVNKSEPNASSGSHSSGRGAQLPSLAPAHEQQQQQRRKQIVRQMLGCYAQDLTPLVNGQKPKLLPVPALASPHLVTSSSVGSSKKSSAPSQSPGARVASQPKAQAKTKKQPRVRLRPIDARARKQAHNNQSDDCEAALVRSSPYRQQQPSLPLTAEIKPIAWVYELGRDVIDDDARSTPTPPLALFQAQQLHSVPEEESGESEYVASALEPQTTKTRASFDLQLQHKLPPKTELGVASTASGGIMSQPFGAASSRSSSSTSSNNSNAGTGSSLQWEYSTDRLASLLEKYNVSVSAAAAPATTATGMARVTT